MIAAMSALDPIAQLSDDHRDSRIFRDDYRAPGFAVRKIELDVALDPLATNVRSRMHLRRRGTDAGPLRLDGIGLRLLSIAVDGRRLESHEYAVDAAGLSLWNPPAGLVLETEVELNVQANESLVGLYLSEGRFCTQCEAEGFRRITYALDRPDALARYTVRIEADSDRYPYLLSNGNCIESGRLPEGRHYARWEDPFPKPSYLFALVAGAFEVLEDRFVTASGRSVELRIYVDGGQASRASYAMEALKRAMRWDEMAFGREYDLDLFMIVAVRDFNFGAMENKGLNIFSSVLLLADAATTTDEQYGHIERIVAHEYFHNWTGNRITCRDWFQLCLKEGLTVLREQLFCMDQRAAASDRIRQVRVLRNRQFPEDLGGLSHAVRPASFVKIDNFYTATVYEKGAEVIRLLLSMLGQRGFREGMDRYFRRCDASAATVEDFLACFSESGDLDIDGLLRWFDQAGLPRLQVSAEYDQGRSVVKLTFAQYTPAAAGDARKRHLPIPVRFGILDEQGRPQTFCVGSAAQGRTDEALLIVNAEDHVVELSGVEHPPVLSMLRGFSAPVLLHLNEPAEHREVRLRADPDLFNRWQAGQDLARELILLRALQEPDVAAERRYATALKAALADAAIDASFKVHLLIPPSVHELSLGMSSVDPAGLQLACDTFFADLARALRNQLHSLHDDGPQPATSSWDARSIGLRALRNAALDLIARGEEDAALDRVSRHYREAHNMTDTVAALRALWRCSVPDWHSMLDACYERWRHEPLAIDQWFAIQAAATTPDALQRVARLSTHAAFQSRNPDRLRSLVATFCEENLATFHRADGAGYRFLADQVLRADVFNPIVAARLIDPLGGWRRHAHGLSEHMRQQLERLRDSPGESQNVHERAATALREGS